MNVHDPMGKAPDEPHLGLVTGPGQVIAIPKGASMMEIMDPTDPKGITMLMLVKVSRGSWKFRCMCNPQCKVVYSHKITGEGQHLPGPGNQKRKR